jgi:hypothetical protein
MERRASELAALRQQALTRPVHGGYPDDAGAGVTDNGKCGWPACICADGMEGLPPLCPEVNGGKKQIAARL